LIGTIWMLPSQIASSSSPAAFTYLVYLFDHSVLLP
jgi:hypothetical protein